MGSRLAGLQASNHVQPAGASRREQVRVPELPPQAGRGWSQLGLQRHRRPHVGRAPEDRPREADGHHADDRVHRAIQPNLAADHARVAAQAPPPERVRDDDHPHRRADPILGSDKAAAERWRDAQHVEVVAGDNLAGELLRCIAALVGHHNGRKRRQAGERPRIAIVRIFEIRGARERRPRVGARRVHADGALWIGHRRVAKQDGVYGGEHRRIGADAQRHRQHDDERERRRVREHPEGVANIANQIRQHVRSPAECGRRQWNPAGPAGDAAAKACPGG